MNPKIRRYATTFAWAKEEHGVKKFRSATQGLPFPVTEEQCKRAVRGDSLNCAAEWAVVDKEGGGNLQVVDVCIMRTTAMVVYLDHGRRRLGVQYRVAGKLKEAIIIFDRSGNFPAGEYTLCRVAPHLRIGQPRHRGTARGPHVRKSGGRAHSIAGLRVGIEVRGKRSR